MPSTRSASILGVLAVAALLDVAAVAFFFLTRDPMILLFGLMASFALAAVGIVAVMLRSATKA